MALPALLAEIGRANDTTKSVSHRKCARGYPSAQSGSAARAGPGADQSVGSARYKMVRAIPDTAIMQQNILEASKRFVKHVIASSRVGGRS